MVQKAKILLIFVNLPFTMVKMTQYTTRVNFFPQSARLHCNTDTG